MWFLLTSRSVHTGHSRLTLLHVINISNTCTCFPNEYTLNRCWYYDCIVKDPSFGYVTSVTIPLKLMYISELLILMNVFGMFDIEFLPRITVCGTLIWMCAVLLLNGTFHCSNWKMMSYVCNVYLLMCLQLHTSQRCLFLGTFFENTIVLSRSWIISWGPSQ